MPPTTHFHRLLLIVPAPRCAGLNAWIRAAIDPTGEDWLTPNLSPTGEVPSTHASACFATTEGIASTFLSRLALTCGIQSPADWANWTRDQKLDWILLQREQIYSNIGVWVEPMRNDGTWSDPNATYARLSLQPLSPQV